MLALDAKVVNLEQINSFPMVRPNSWKWLHHQR